MNTWRPIANAFCPTGEGGGIDPHCSPSGGKSSATKAVISKVQTALDSLADLVKRKDLPKIARKTLEAGKNALIKTLDFAANRYGNKESILTFLTAQGLASAAFMLSGAGTPLGAAAFALSAVEARNAIGALVGAVEPNSVRNAADEETLKKVTQAVKNLFDDFSEATGLEMPEVDPLEVESLLADLAD